MGERHVIAGRIGAHESWSRTEDRTARTAPGREAFLARFERQVDPDGKLSPAERERRAEHARKAHFQADGAQVRVGSCPEAGCGMSGVDVGRIVERYETGRVQAHGVLALPEPGELGGALDTTGDPVAAVLALCDRGRVALAEAQTIAEGQNVLGVLSTLEHAVKVRDLNAEACVAASAMRVRAERRMGELIRDEREAGTLAKPEDGPRLRAARNETPAQDPVPQGNGMPETLADHGISRKQAAEFGRLADAAPDTFEKAVEAEAEKAEEQGGLNVTRAGVLRRINPEREKSQDTRWIEADRFFTTCKKLAQQKDGAITALRFGVYPGDLPLVGGAVRRALDEAIEALGEVRREMDRRQP